MTDATNAAGTATNAETGAAGTPSPADAGSAGNGPQDGQTATPDAGTVTMTQAQLDAIISKRVTAAKKSAQEEAQAQAQKAQMTEADRLKAERDEAQAQAKTAQASADQRVVTMEAKLAALSAGADPAQIDYVLRLVDLADVTVAEGQADVTAITAAVGKVKADLPALFGVHQPGTANVQKSGTDMGQQPSTVRAFTTAELRELQKDPVAYAELQPEIDKAFKAGKIVQNT